MSGSRSGRSLRTMNIEEAKEFYLSRYADLERGLIAGGRSWTREPRRNAMARFAALGFPTTHDEEWRYTSVAPLAKIPFATADRETNVGAEQIAEFDGADCRLVFINGRFCSRLSRFSRLPDGVIA